MDVPVWVLRARGAWPSTCVPGGDDMRDIIEAFLLLGGALLIAACVMAVAGVK